MSKKIKYYLGINDNRKRIRAKFRVPYISDAIDWFRDEVLPQEEVEDELISEETTERIEIKDSSNVQLIAYSAANNVLMVQYINGYIYFYYDISLDQWENFKKAPSKGEWVWENLRREPNVEYEMIRD